MTTLQAQTESLGYVEVEEVMNDSTEIEVSESEPSSPSDKDEQTVYTKDDLVKALVKNLARHGWEITEEEAWILFSLNFLAALELGAGLDQKLKLRGMGTYDTQVSECARRKGLPSLKPRFRPSKEVQRALNGGKSLV